MQGSLNLLFSLQGAGWTVGDQAWKTEPDGVAVWGSKGVLKQGDEKRMEMWDYRADEGTSGLGVRRTEGRDKIREALTAVFCVCTQGDVFSGSLHFFC